MRSKHVKGIVISNNSLVVILILTIIIFVCSLVFLVIRKNNLNIPDYPTNETDDNAVKEEDSDKQEYKEGSGSVDISFSNNVVINKKTGDTELFFKNPGSSTDYAILNLIIVKEDKEIIIGETDKIPAGYAIYKMNCNNLSEFSVGDYEGILRIVYYNSITNAKEMINSEIKVNIKIK